MSPLAADMGSGQRSDRDWRVAHLQQEDDGKWSVGVQFDDGSALQLLLDPSRDLDLVIEQAVAAHRAGDVRWTKRSDRR